MVRQICAKYGLEREDVEAQFDSIAETIQPDRDEGITSRQVLERCKLREINGYIVRHIALVGKHEVEDQYHNEKSLCLQVVGYHAYVMKDAYTWKARPVCQACMRLCLASSTFHQRRLDIQCSKNGRLG